ncbi:MAG: DUF4097 domain-containing protein [Lachnospiraceae bacterium]|jgi:hypothetical protein|uniref:DUF4097 family beta strand repeat-containing protein n=1 Tax=Candidatus Merdisoma sp. JLR.KK011 TaxID=3114299 RepID=UPI0014344882|nr:DUF4097 domain-containing protein [Lachnospiraceae bacterium]MCI9307407.1 DUF4097 domain-containing protein [Lachnospiraceae bacterium]MCI9480387.1 DUF4097 domain-containing protein [Lachnospiraceae bacterium]MCI9623882.1 DUF4097 domain-containing protein [Lachnospiraceae bacterium]GFI11047.1 hypothetical protein IMSAGC007_03520 [Lachnospiraceae bacterium]
MKSLTKFCLIVASIFVVLGLVGVVAGVSLGARPDQFLRMVNYHNDILPWGWGHNYWGFWNDWDLADDIDDLHEDLQDELDDLRDDMDDWQEDVEDWNDDWQEDVEDWENEMDEWGNVPGITEKEEAAGEGMYVDQGVFGGAHTEKLKLDLDRSSVKIYTHDGEGIQIKAQNTKDYFKIIENGDTLLLEDHRGNHRRNALLLELYLPERSLEKIELELGASKLQIESLLAEKLELDMGAGEAKINTIEAEKADIGLGAGELKLDSLTAEKAYLQVGTGILGVKRFAGGDLALECGIGSLDINVQGKESDYNYAMSCGIGEIDLNGRQYSGLGREKVLSNNASKKISMECGIGSINLKMIEE